MSSATSSARVPLLLLTLGCGALERWVHVQLPALGWGTADSSTGRLTVRLPPLLALPLPLLDSNANVDSSEGARVGGTEGGGSGYSVDVISALRRVALAFGLLLLLRTVLVHRDYQLECYKWVGAGA